MEDELADHRVYAAFDKYEEFRNIQDRFLAVDLSLNPTDAEERQETLLLRKLSDILGEYQEQSYLLDPFLESLVIPVVECFRTHAKRAVLDSATPWSSARIERVALLFHSYITLRGYKTIIRFFPHEITDLLIALEYIQMPHGLCQDLSQWALRYIVLLWLSLICKLPFDLSQFDTLGQAIGTADALETLGKGLLCSAGLQREGAALLLSRLFVRKDTLTRFHDFLEHFNHEFDRSADVFSYIGFLQVLCEVVKSGPVELAQTEAPNILRIQSAIEESPAYQTNTLVRKFKVKLISRLALRVLLPRREVGGTDGTNTHNEADIDMPEAVEPILESLFQCLQDRDTVVRWSAAKGIARISARLPVEYAGQVLDTVLGLFAIHSVAVARLYDMPTIAEATWHGACLACAEMARGGLVAPEQLPNLLEWISKALYFDIRRGAHSIGSGVRDAAAYVLWALARAQKKSALAPLAPSLAQRLINVALFDREIHIRRAASAAFQEFVGRTSLFPHGITVLSKADFFAVSVRRTSFIVAAPEVAEHVEYRDTLLGHLLEVTARHWDVSMRELGAQSLRLICLVDLDKMGPRALQEATTLLDSVDIADIHGALWVLGELALAYKEACLPEKYEKERSMIFDSLSRIQSDLLKAPRNGIVTIAACRLITNCITKNEIHLEEHALSTPIWRQIVQDGLHHKDENVQRSAANAMAAISKLTDCSLVVKRLKNESARAPVLQRCLGHLFRALDYTAYSHDLPDTIHFLLDRVGPSKLRFEELEARKNLYEAIPQILNTVATRLTEYVSVHDFRRLFDALRGGLNDYTIDTRGDVGSWIRVVCIRGLSSIITLLFAQASAITNFGEYLPVDKYHDAVGGILKQGAERLDHVRQEAGQSFLCLLQNPPPAIASGELWRIHGEALMRRLFLGGSEIVGWHDSDWLYPRAVQLLEVTTYRKQVFSGLVMSIASKTDSTQRPVAVSLASYARSLPLNSTGAGYDLCQLVKDLLDQAKCHPTLNATVIPVLQTFNVLLEADVMLRLRDNREGIESLCTLLGISSRNISRLKNVQRIQECMKTSVNLLEFSQLYDDCVSIIGQFLVHQFPKIRSQTAEYLYLFLQSKDIPRETEKAEEILLDTEWSSEDTSVVVGAARSLVQSMMEAPIS